jgi:hypothetical protein
MLNTGWVDTNSVAATRSRVFAAVSQRLVITNASASIPNDHVGILEAAPHVDGIEKDHEVSIK